MYRKLVLTRTEPPFGANVSTKPSSTRGKEEFTVGASLILVNSSKLHLRNNTVYPPQLTIVVIRQQPGTLLRSHYKAKDVGR